MFHKKTAMFIPCRMVLEVQSQPSKVRAEAQAPPVEEIGAAGVEKSG